MRNALSSSLLLLALTCASPLTVSASEPAKEPSDKVTFTLFTEGWVSTKTARVVLNVESSATGSAAGNMRGTMAKAINDVVKADWRLVRFNKLPDRTGMERWSAGYEARIAEDDLSDLSENAKKVSKAGMQITVGGIDFTPTLDETQATYSSLRTDIYKKALEQQSLLNATITGRSYRIAHIEFDRTEPNTPRAMSPAPFLAMSKQAAEVADGGDALPEQEKMERAEKLTVVAHVIMAAEAKTDTAETTKDKDQKEKDKE